MPELGRGSSERTKFLKVADIFHSLQNVWKPLDSGWGQVLLAFCDRSILYISFWVLLSPIVIGLLNDVITKQHVLLTLIRIRCLLETTCRIWTTDWGILWTIWSSHCEIQIPTTGVPGSVCPRIFQRPTIFGTPTSTRFAEKSLPVSGFLYLQTWFGGWCTTANVGMCKYNPKAKKYDFSMSKKMNWDSKQLIDFALGDFSVFVSLLKRVKPVKSPTLETLLDVQIYIYCMKQSNPLIKGIDIGWTYTMYTRSHRKQYECGKMLRQGTVSKKNAAIKCNKKVDMNVKPMLETAKNMLLINVPQDPRCVCLDVSVLFYCKN